jgi:hypothetical protein
MTRHRVWTCASCLRIKTTPVGMPPPTPTICPVESWGPAGGAWCSYYVTDTVNTKSTAGEPGNEQTSVVRYGA